MAENTEVKDAVAENYAKAQMESATQTLESLKAEIEAKTKERDGIVAALKKTHASFIADLDARKLAVVAAEKAVAVAQETARGVLAKAEVEAHEIAEAKKKVEETLKVYSGKLKDFVDLAKKLGMKE